MRFLFQTMILVVVFVVSSEAIEYIGEMIPGTPAQRLDFFLEGRYDAVETLDKLDSQTGQRLVTANSNWILLVYWPIACAITSVLARVLRIPVALLLSVLAVLLVIQLVLMKMNARYFEEFSGAVGRSIWTGGVGSSTAICAASVILCLALSALFRCIPLPLFRVLRPGRLSEG